MFFRSGEELDLGLLAERRELSRDGRFGFPGQGGFDAGFDGGEVGEDFSTVGDECLSVFVGATVSGVRVANVEPWAVDGNVGRQGWTACEECGDGFGELSAAQVSFVGVVR